MQETNAVQYAPDGGSIRVRWHGEDRGAIFQVVDSGIGIEDHDVPRLTERFYRVDDARSRGMGGSGLGLVIVKHVLMRYDATLEVESALGEGSTSTCRFAPGRVVRAADADLREAS